MENRIPLPTDNVYKFYALFGLLLLIFCGTALLYVNQSANERFFSLYPQLEALKQLPKPSAEELAKITILKRSIEISMSDKDFFTHSIGALGGIALFLSGFGFYKWEKTIQPIQDRAAKAQAELIELQLVKLKRELGVEASCAATEGATQSTPIVESTPASQPPSIDSSRPQVI